MKKWIVLIGIMALFYSPIISYAQGTETSCEVSKKDYSGTEKKSTHEEGEDVGLPEIYIAVGIPLLVLTLLGGIIFYQIDHIYDNIG